jgi:hypothetical protein
MRGPTIGALFLLASIPACATDSAPPNGGGSAVEESDEETTNPDPDAEVCSTTDGVCIDRTACTSDPDCADVVDPPANCTPTALPAAPRNVVSGVSGLFSPASVAATTDRVYLMAYTNATPSSTKIYSCPLTGCAASPTGFGTGIDPQHSFLAAFGGNVYWSAKQGDFATHPDRVFRANPDGSAATAVISVDDGAGYYADISPGVGIFDDYALVVDATARTGTSSSSTSAPGAGIRVVTDSLVSPSMPGVSTPPYSDSAVAGDDQYLVYYANSISGTTSPYDRKIHVYDLDGQQLGVSATTFGSVSKLEIVGSSLLFHADSGLMACALPGCTNLRNVGTAVNKRGFTFAVTNGRVYFASVADQGCEQGLTGVLASCATDALLAGTCTPTLHSTSIHWVNMKSLSVTSTHAVMASKTASTSAFVTSL